MTARTSLRGSFGVPSLHGGGRGEPEVEAIQFKTVAAFHREYVPLSYAIEPIIRSSALYTLTAKTGGGKTALLVDIALAVATGRNDLLGMEVQQGRVVYLSFENPDDVRMRFGVAAYLFNIDLQAIGENIIVLDARKRPDEIIKGLQKNADAYGAIRLVIGDTLAAWFDGNDVNDNVQAGEFIRRCRPLTRLPGLPSVVLAAHPVKNATEQQLIPYGGGAILNEIDGNLTLWKQQTGLVSLHWQGKLRGIEFTPRLFRFDISSSPDLLDVKGRQVQIPIMRRSNEQAAEERMDQDARRNVALLKAMLSNPDGPQRVWAQMAGTSVADVNRRLKVFEKQKEKLVKRGTVTGKWALTDKGRKEVEELSK